MTDHLDQIAAELAAKGWRPIWVTSVNPPRVQTGSTGYGGTDLPRPADAETLAVGCPDGVMMLDVDHYGGKLGGDTLRGLESELGALPPTWRITSREPANPSGKLPYSVPSGTVLKGSAGKDIDTVQRHHRWTWAPGTRHPKTQTTVAVYGPDGRATGLPAVTELPELPAAWLAYLDNAGASDGQVITVTVPDDGKTVCSIAAAWLAGKDYAGASAQGQRAHDAVVYLKRKAAAGHYVAGIIGQVQAALPTTTDRDWDDMWDRATVEQDWPDVDLTCCGRGDAMLDNLPHAAPVLNAAISVNGSGPPAVAAVPMPAVPGRRIVRTLASDIKPERVKWLWRQRIPAGEFSVIGGREGTGKTLAAFDRAALITKGKLDGECHGRPAPVAVVATEDAWSKTIVPRLIGAGADLSRIHKLAVDTGFDTESELDLPYDNGLLQAELADSGAVLLILDPLMSRLSAALDSHKDADVRRALEPLAHIAHETGCAILGILHVNKSGTTDALSALMGSRAFAAVARSVQFVMADPTDDAGQRRLYATVKNNLGRADLPIMAFTIAEKTVAEDDGRPVTTGVLRWTDGAPQVSVSSLLGQAGKADKVTETDKAAAWVAHFLRYRKDGRADSKEVKAAAKKAGFSEATLKRALRQAEVVIENTATVPRRTEWVLCDGTVGMTLPSPTPVGSRAGGHEPTEPTGARETLNELTTTHWPAEMPARPVGSVGSVGSPLPAREPTGNRDDTVTPRDGAPSAAEQYAASLASLTPEQVALLERLRCEDCAPYERCERHRDGTP